MAANRGVAIEMHYCLTKLYFEFFIKKISYIAISKNCFQYVFFQYIEVIVKPKAHEQIKQSDYVLFSFLKISLKKFFEKCNKLHFIWKLRCGKGKRKNLNHSVMERG